MNRLLRVLFIVAIGTAGCTGSPSPYQVGPQEVVSLDVIVPDARREALVSALRDAVSRSLAGGISGSADVNSWGQYQGPLPTAVSAGTNLYTSALDDAQHKAEAIAHRLHATLGDALSVTEAVESFPSGALKGNQPQSFVRVSPEQPVVLYVVFQASATTGGPQSIGVYGLSSAQPMTAPNSPQTSDIRVQITGRGRDINAAVASADKLEAAVRDTLASQHILARDVRVSGTSFTQP